MLRSCHLDRRLRLDLLGRRRRTAVLAPIFFLLLLAARPILSLRPVDAAAGDDDDSSSPLSPRLPGPTTRTRRTLPSSSSSVDGDVDGNGGYADADAEEEAPPPHPGGPIATAGMHPYVDEYGGVQVPAAEYIFHPRDHVKREQWEADWIWLSEQPAPATIGRFRAELHLESSPLPYQSISAYVSADALYRLWINGILVSRGPPDHGRDYFGSADSSGHWYYDARNLTSCFRAGARNVVAIEVLSHRGAVLPVVVTGGQPGFLFELRGRIDGVTSNDTLLLKSDASGAWRSYAPDPHEAWSYWQAPDYDDSHWGFASKITAPADAWQTLIPSEIPPRMEVDYPVQDIRGLPADGILRGDGTFEVIFDRVISGYAQVRLRGGKGARVVLNATIVTPQTTLSGGEGIVATVEHPYMTEIAPSYRVHITNVSPGDPVHILYAGAYFTSQPISYRGTFDCDDAQLNQLWNVSRHAVQINMHDRYMDSPNHQEPISDFGDYMIESMVSFYAFGPDSAWLVKQDLRKFGWVLSCENYTAFMPSYALYWIRTLLDYYDYSGDEAFVLEMIPHVRGVMERYHCWIGPNTGIISEAPNYMFMDWVTISGFECHHPPAVIGQGYMSALYHHGLGLAIRAARLAGDAEMARTYACRQRSLAEAFRRELWVESEGLFRDGHPHRTSVPPSKWLPPDGENVATRSPHVNFLAVLFGLTPSPSLGTSILEHFLAAPAPPLNVQMWFHHWIFAALDESVPAGGRLFEQYAVPLLRRWEVIPETQSFREMWGAGDYSHGWCSTPLVQLSTRVLGVQPASPGFERIRIQPRPCVGLGWARGGVPTPRGDVVVSWARSADGGDGGSKQFFVLNVTVPPGAEAEVILPDGTARAVGSGDHNFRSAEIAMSGEAPPAVTV